MQFYDRYPPPRLARTAFLRFRRQASSLHSTYLLTHLYLLTHRTFLPLKGPDIGGPPCVPLTPLRSFPGLWTPLGPPRCVQDAFKMAFVDHHFFDVFVASILNRFLMPTWLQLASENRRKSMKHRCQELSSSCIYFLSFLDRFVFDFLFPGTSKFIKIIQVLQFFFWLSAFSR